MLQLRRRKLWYNVTSADNDITSAHANVNFVPTDDITSAHNVVTHSWSLSEHVL